MTFTTDNFSIKTELGRVLPYLGLSPHMEYANTTLYWMQADNQERFLRNNLDAKAKQKLDAMGWTEENITYTYNEYGFRSDSFEGEGVLFLGCSFTQGCGIDWERSWPYLVAKELNLKCWNLGISGSSNDTAFRLASYWIPQLKPKYVCYLPTLPPRVEIVTPTRFEHYLPMFPYQGADKQFYDKWVSMNENINLNYDKNVRGVKSICVENNIPCIAIESHNRFHNTYQDWGRDLLHHGPTWNRVTADKFLDLM